MNFLDKLIQDFAHVSAIRGQLEIENAALQKKLIVAIEALEVASQGQTQFDGVEAMYAVRQALKEIRSEK
jgi:hypothetical protein